MGSIQKFFDRINPFKARNQRKHSQREASVKKVKTDKEEAAKHERGLGRNSWSFGGNPYKPSKKAMKKKKSRQRMTKHSRKMNNQHRKRMKAA